MTLSEADLDTITLDHGNHRSPEQGYCLMEAVSMFAKEPFTDAPTCVSTYLRRFGISLNDRANDERRQDLRRFIPLVVGTAGDGLDEKRRWSAADYVTRVTAPTWLDRAGLTEHAQALRDLPSITDRATYNEAYPFVSRARDAAWALRRERRRPIIDAVREAVQQRFGSVAAAVAVAVAVAVAAAVADAVAAADAVADAAAAADADAAAVADWSVGSDNYWTVRDAVYTKLRAIYEERYADVVAESWSDALDLYERLIFIGTESEAVA
jgi:hypothetical protein